MIAVHRSSFAFRGLVTIATILLLTSCTQDDPTEPIVSELMLAKGGRGPKVNETVPPDAPQDTTLYVRVIGSGFDDGSEVMMTLDGTPDSSVQTNSTQFFSSTELLVNITIDLAADTALYDVEVMTMRGKKGIGVDMFRVRLKGSNSATVLRDVNMWIPDTLPTGLTNSLKSDTLGLYIGSDRNHLENENGECGVVAVAGSTFSLWPFYGGMNRKQLRDFERAFDCGVGSDGKALRRAATINLADALVHRACWSDDAEFVLCENSDPMDHVGEVTLQDMIDAGLDSIVGAGLDSIVGTDTVRNFKLAHFDTGNSRSRGGFQVAYCGGLGFVDDGQWGLYALEVDNSDPSHVYVGTQAGQDKNVASCGHLDTVSGRAVVLLLHVDIAYEVIDKQ